MNFKSFISKNKRSVILIGVIGVLSLSFSSIISVYAYAYQDTLLELSLTSWAFVFLGLSITLVAGFTPSTFISIVAGYFLWWYSLPYVVVSYVIALSIAFFVAKKVDKGIFWETFKDHPEVSRIQNNIAKTELIVVILARISPILPFAIMNMILPILGISFRSFITGGIIGMLPRTILSIWLGTQLFELNKSVNYGQDNQTYTVLVVIMVIVSIAGLLRYGFKIVKG